MRKVAFSLIFLALVAPAERGSSPADAVAPQRVAAIAEKLRNRVRELDIGLGVSNRRHAATFSENGLEFVPRDASGCPVEELRFGYRLATVSRGEEVIGRSTPAETASEGNTVSFTRSAGLIERYICLDRGVEQTLVLTEKLPGEGDLLIRGELSTALEPSRSGVETMEAVTFISPEDGRKAVTYGKVTVFDSSGRRTSASVCATLDSITIRVPGGWLDGADYPVTVDPLIGSEILLCDDSSLQTGAQNSQYDPRVACAGGVALVVWEDWRNSATTGCDIYGARIDSSGNVLDPDGIAICQATDHQYDPRVATNGTGFFVAWEDNRDSATTESDIYGARMDVSGNVLEPGGAVVCNAANNQVAPEVDSNGTDYLVVWTYHVGMFGGEDIYCARVTSGGSFGSVALVCDAAEEQYNPRVASNGSNWLVVWYDYRDKLTTGFDIYGARIDATGNVLDTANGVVISDALKAQRNPHVASNGTDYLVAWDDLTGADYDTYCARVTGGGTYPTNDGTVVCAAVGHQTNAQVASNGSDWLVVWSDTRDQGTTGYDIYGSRVAANGTVLEAGGTVICNAAGDQYHQGFASNGTDYFVVWWDDRDSATTGFDIYGAVITGVGDYPTDDGTLLCGAIQAQERACVAPGLGGYVAVWSDARLSAAVSNEIFATRVDGSGNALDGDGLQLTVGYGSRQQRPQVAFNGSVYLAVWEEARGPTGRDIYGTRIDTSGDILDDPAGEVICDAPYDQRNPRVATNSTDFLVVWRDYRNEATTGVDVYGAVVTGAGSFPTDDGTAICTATEGQYDPRITSNGSDYLVVWSDNRSGSDIDIYGMRVGATGTLLDAANGVAASVATGDQYKPEVASDGTDYLVVWVDRRSGIDSDIYGAPVTSAGVYGSNVPVCTVGGDQDLGHVTANCSDYLVVWADDRGAERDIYGSRVTWDGSTLSVLEPGGTAICAAAGYQERPRVASNGTDYLVVWEGEDGGGETYDIYCGVVTSDGIYPSDDGTLVSNTSGDQYEPVVASNGRDYLVVWYEGNGSDDMYGTGVDGTGVVDIPGGEAISSLAGDQYEFSLAAEPLGKYLVVYGDEGNNRGFGYDVYGQFVRGVNVPLPVFGGGCGVGAGTALALLAVLALRRRRE